MDLKKKFGISELLTEYALSKILKEKLDFEIKHKTIALGAVGVEVAKLSFEYAAYLNETKLTPELVEKLFEGLAVLESKDPTIKHAFLINESIILEFGMVYGGGTSVKAFVVDTLIEKTIETLADLARLTAANPIPLA